MPQIGASPVSLKGDGPWRGMTTKSKATPFHFELLENCYVSSDGMEIRTFPGWKCVIDPVTTARTATMTPSQTQALGYERTTIDAKRPFKTASGVYFKDTAPTETMVVWSQPTHVHGVEQIRGRWVFFGESGDRFEPINDLTNATYVRVTGYDDNGVNTDLTINTDVNTAANSFNGLRAGGGDEITLSGLTGAAAASLNGKRHTVVSVTNAGAATIVKISTNIGAIAAVTGQSAFISRVTPKGGTIPSADISDDEESLTTWTCTSGGSVSSLTEVVYSAFVANRHRDFGDSTGNIKEGNSFGTNGQSRRRQKVIPYRIVPHVAGNRLVLVAPGYSCVFQAPMLVPINYDENDNTFVDSYSGVGWFGNDIYDKPRAMGLPKAVCHEDPDKDPATSFHVSAPGTDALSFGGNSLGRDGTYKFKFAYKDDATGDVGLCSEPISITTNGGAGARQGLRFLILFPGYLMHETLGMSINVYRTEKNGSTFYFDRTIPMASFTNAAASGAESARYGLTPNAADAKYYYHAQYDAIYQTDAQLVLQQGEVPDSIEQMPRGAKCARTIRGWTFYGGSLGNTGNRLELLAGNLSLVYDRVASTINGVHYAYDVLSAQGPGTSFTSVDGGFGCSATGIPTAYVGEFVFSRTLLPYPRQLAQINKVVNTDVGWPGLFPFGVGPPTYETNLTDIRYQILDTPLRPESDFSNPNRPTLLVLPRGRIQISEPDHPSVVPATNSTVIANELDEDIEAIGDMGGQAVICSRNKTYMLGFSQTPVGVPAEIASDRFGCIAPNSMVEFDGGCAWLSDRGPCAMVGGQVQWIGEPLEEWFIGETSRYLRDSQGMMRHSWACHDAERGLIYFGLFANRAKVESSARTITYRGTSYTWDAADALGIGTGDEIKSRFPCDEILVYSYKVGAWSVWRPPVGMEVKWMTRGQDAQGNNRVFFLGVDNRLYVLDDTYSMFNRDSVKNVALASSTGTTISMSSSLGQSVSDIGVGETYWRSGMPVLVMSSDGLTVRGTSTVNTVSGTSLTTDTAIPVTAGDFVIVGARTATIKTNYINLKGSEAAVVGKAGMRYGLRNRYSAQISGATTTALAAAKVQVVTNRQIDGAMTAVTAGLTSDTAAAQYTALAAQGAQAEYSLERSFALGRAQGHNHRVEMTLIGSAQVRMSDLYVEVQ